jgi:serine protease Do
MEQPKMSFPNSANFRPRSLRAALLGAVAIVAVGGVALEAVPQFANVAAAATSASPAGPASFADVVDRVKGAVVSVKVKISEDGGDEQAQERPHMPDFAPGSPLDRFFKQFGEGQDGEGGMQGMHPHHPHLSMAQGSGFFISADGYIVTNNHVVDHATEVTVTTTDGKTMAAKVIGTDSKSDLALLKVKDGGNYPFVSFATEAPRVGDWVIAVGNPFGLGGTVTAGIVSARGRDIGSGPYDDFLQIDAPVNRGNSGGPTFNGEGQVVGVNTAIFSPSGGSVGIGFAISSDVVKSVVASLKDHGSVARGWLGVEIQPVSEDIADSLGVKDPSGALVARENSNSPAAASGVKVGDVITAVNGDKVADPRELARRIAALGPKKTAQLAIMRNGSAQTIDVMLGAMPAEKQQAKFEEPATPQHMSNVAKLGLTLKRNGDDEGVKVSDVDQDSVAADHGMQAGDVILDAGGKTVSKPEDVAQALDSAKSDGKKALLLRVKTQDNVRFVALPVKAAS